MYKKIVVPLDGSKLAESVLPHVEQIAGGRSTTKVILVSVTGRIVGQMGVTGGRGASTPVTDEAPATVIQDLSVPLFDKTTPSKVEEASVSLLVGRMQKQAENYLKRISKRLHEKKVNAEFEVLLGNPAEEIVTFANEKEVDLIIIASHGRSGISKWAHGNVADRVFRSADTPVLMIKAPAGTPDKLGR